MKEYENYKINELRSLCKQLGIKVTSRNRAAFLEALENYFLTPREEPAEEEHKILYFPNTVYSPELGRFERGYHLFRNEEADKWLAVAKRVRIADPKEVAAYYGE